MNLHPLCAEAVNAAKRALAEGEALTIGLLMEALYTSAGLTVPIPGIGRYLRRPVARRPATPKTVPVAANLQAVLGRIVSVQPPLEPLEFFLELARCDDGRSFLLKRGIPAKDLEEILGPEDGDEGDVHGPSSESGSGASSSSSRAKALDKLSSYGRVLTDASIRVRVPAEFGKPMQTLIRTLAHMRRRSAIVAGYPGTGKTAMVYELARRMEAGDASLPEFLRSCDIFELSTSFLRSGASLVGEYEQRVKELILTLEGHPDIILFIDEIHTFFQSGVHSRGAFSDANESLKNALTNGLMTVIGCTTLSEYRYFIEPDKALERRFRVIKLDPPSGETTIAILKRKLPSFGAYYTGLRIPEEILPRIVELTDRHMPSSMQPDKSIQLLDEACACCITSAPPLEELDEQVLLRVLEDRIGPGLVCSERVTETSVYDMLRESILGQDETIKDVSRAFVTGLSAWKSGRSPRGVYVFGGPTGVGKTETAVRLAAILGKGSDRLIRVDCNTLQGSGYDQGPMINRLLGVPPGYLGYARGQGGILSRIRDFPESVILFDEVEKAPVGLGHFLLQIFDNGSIEDVDGNLLDFRRAFIIMTTNLGCSYDKRALGFTSGDGEDGDTPSVDGNELLNGLRQVGYGEEFLGRISHTFLFRGLDSPAVREILKRQFAGLRSMAEKRGLNLDWSERLLDHLVAQWQPRFGVRHLTSVLNNRVTEQMSLAEAHGEMQGVVSVRLDLLHSDGGERNLEHVGLALREKHSDQLIVRIR